MALDELFICKSCERASVDLERDNWVSKNISAYLRNIYAKSPQDSISYVYCSECKKTGEEEGEL